MPSTTVKVPRELRDRLAEIAKADGTTLAGAIEKALEAHDDAAFWEGVARTMSAPALHREAYSFDGALTDGLDADEDWSDVW